MPQKSLVVEMGKLGQPKPPKLFSYKPEKVFEKVPTGAPSPYLVAGASHEYQCL